MAIPFPFAIIPTKQMKSVPSEYVYYIKDFAEWSSVEIVLGMALLFLVLSITFILTDKHKASVFCFLASVVSLIVSVFFV